MLALHDIMERHVNIIGALPIFQFLSKDAGEDQSDININANGDYSSALTKFKLTSSEGLFFILTRLLVSIEDDGKFSSGAYGKDLVLTNGITLSNGGDTFDEWTVTGIPIKTNPGWNKYCRYYNLSNYGTGNETLSVVWDFTEMGRPVILDGDIHEFVALNFNDDFTDLVSQYFQIQGLRIRKG